MDRTVFLHKTSSSAFLEAVNQARAQNLGRAKQKYLLCRAILTTRRMALATLKEEGLDTTKLQKMILRLEASEAAHLRLIHKLEDW